MISSLLFITLRYTICCPLRCSFTTTFTTNFQLLIHEPSSHHSFILYNVTGFATDSQPLVINSGCAMPSSTTNSLITAFAIGSWNFIHQSPSYHAFVLCNIHSSSPPPRFLPFHSSKLVSAYVRPVHHLLLVASATLNPIKCRFLLPFLWFSSKHTFTISYLYNHKTQ